MRRALAAACLPILLATACGPGNGDGPEVPQGRVVQFSTDDGVELTGELRGNGDLGVILAHSFPTDRTAWAPLAQEMAEEGYAALTFDFRGYGDSAGERSIPDIWRDVLAAIRFLQGEGISSIVLIGASMGGTASLVAAARDDLAAVITLSAPSTFNGLLAPPEALQVVDEPKLFIAAQGDGAAAATAQGFYAQSPGPKRVEIVTGDDHGTELLEGDQAEAVRMLIFSFLRQHG